MHIEPQALMEMGEEENTQAAWQFFSEWLFS